MTVDLPSTEHTQLTEDDVRRIVREEVADASTQDPGLPPRRHCRVQGHP